MCTWSMFRCAHLVKPLHGFSLLHLKFQNYQVSPSEITRS